MNIPAKNKGIDRLLYMLCFNSTRGLFKEAEKSIKALSSPFSQSEKSLLS